MDAQLSSVDNRDVVFISHANPEDNAFATWLTLRLTREGYRVWCDVVRLKGGDDFWRDIEKAIRERTRKFVYVVSKTSNQKEGALRELSVASAVARQLGDSSFIVPVKIDDLPYAEHNIQINRLIAIAFNQSWASGYTELLSAFEDDNVPRPETVGPSIVAAWWNSNRLNKEILKRRPETLWTNWFPVVDLPKLIWLWKIPENARLPEVFPYPTYRTGNCLFSFADATALTEEENSPTGGPGGAFTLRLNREPPKWTEITGKEVLIAVKQLLCDAWVAMAEQHGLPIYLLSNRRKSLWFPKDYVKNDRVAFTGINGEKSWRDLCGFKTIRKSDGETIKRIWHYGLEALPILYPSPALVLKYHVFFTLDGKTIFGDAKYQHRARRSQCKLWWNDKWRDLMFAAVSCLTEGNSVLPLCVSPDSELAMQSRPFNHRIRVSYDDAQMRDNPTEESCESDDEEAEEALEA